MHEVIAHVVLYQLAPQLDNLAGGQCHLHALDIVSHDAVLDGPDAAGVLDGHAAHLGALVAGMAGEIQGVDVLVQVLVQLGQGDTGLAGDHHIGLIHLQDLPEALHGHDDGGHRRNSRAAGAGAAAPGDDGGLGLVAQLQDGGDLLVGAGPDHHTVLAGLGPDKLLGLVIEVALNILVGKKYVILAGDADQGVNEFLFHDKYPFHKSRCGHSYSACSAAAALARTFFL